MLGPQLGADFTGKKYRLTRTLENITYEKRVEGLFAYLLLSLTEARSTGYNALLHLHKRLLLKGRNNLFQVSYAKNNELILKQGRLRSNIS